MMCGKVWHSEQHRVVKEDFGIIYCRYMNYYQYAEKSRVFRCGRSSRRFEMKGARCVRRHVTFSRSVSAETPNSTDVRTILRTKSNCFSLETTCVCTDLEPKTRLLLGTGGGMEGTLNGRSTFWGNLLSDLLPPIQTRRSVPARSPWATLTVLAQWTAVDGIT